MGSPPAPTDLPSPLPAGSRRELAAENEGRWRLLDERRLDPDRPPSGGYRRLSGLKVSTTDPDATLMFDGRKSLLGYHDHYGATRSSETGRDARGWEARKEEAST